MTLALRRGRTWTPCATGERAPGFQAATILNFTCTILEPPIRLPAFSGATRAGDNLYTSCVVALNVDTGKLAWYFQPSPHDTHDWDAAQTPVIVDGEFNGKPRKLLLDASRNGYFFVLDRVTGEHLLTMPYARYAQLGDGRG